MKTISLIILGSLLTVGAQVFLNSDFSFIKKAEASEPPCDVIINDNLWQFQRSINMNYKKGYRVKGAGYAPGFNKLAIMCK